MIGGAGWWTQTASTTLLQPKKWNAHFWITFNFWWSARLVDGLECHPPPLSSQRMKCSFLDYVQLLMISWAGQWTQTPSTIPLQPRNEMLISGLCSTSDDWQGRSMDSKPIHHPPPAKKMKCLFLDYVQLLMIGQAGQWTQNPSATLLQPKKWNAHFWIMFNFWWSAGLVHGLETHPPPLSSQKMKCLFLDYFQFLVISQAGRWTQTPSTTLLQPKNEMLIFGLHSTSDDWPGWPKDSNPICNLFPTKKWNAYFCITL